MKILHLSKPWFPVPPIDYGGVERQIYSLILDQIKFHEVHLFAPGDSKVDAAIHLHATEQLTTMAQEKVVFVFLSKQHRSDFPWIKNGAVVYPGLQTAASPSWPIRSRTSHL